MIIVIAATPRCERTSIFSGINGGVGRPSLSLSAIIARLFSNSFQSVYGIESDTNWTKWMAIGQEEIRSPEEEGKVSFPKVDGGGKRRTANERARKLENLAEKSGRRVPPQPGFIRRRTTRI